MSQEEYSSDGTELDGFSEVDDNGVTHHVGWEIAEIEPNVEFEAWWCTTHDRIYYGGCNKGGKN